MSKPNPQAERAEYINCDMTLTIKVHGQEIYRKYSLTDGQAPDNMQEEVQDIVDTLLDNEEEF